jgi:hypothetical protein
MTAIAVEGAQWKNIRSTAVWGCPAVKKAYDLSRSVVGCTVPLDCAAGSTLAVGALARTYTLTHARMQRHTHTKPSHIVPPDCAAGPTLAAGKSWVLLLCMFVCMCVCVCVCVWHCLNVSLLDANTELALLNWH